MSDAELTAPARASMPLAETLGLEVVAASPEEVRARLAYQERLCTAGGILHGGALMSLADAAGAYCAFLNLPEGATGTATIESKTNFFRAVRDGPRRRDLARRSTAAGRRSSSRPTCTTPPASTSPASRRRRPF